MIALGALVIITIPSCDSWLELTPPDGLVKDEFWKSKEDIEAVLMGAYQKFASLDEKLFLFGELRADLITDDQNTANEQRLIMEGNIYPDNSLCNWSNFYTVISYCNSVLKYTSEVMEIDQTFTEYQKLGFEAEAIYLRSLAYFYLVRVFKEVPLVLEPTEADDADYYLPKSADTTILNRIKGDLESVRFFATDDYGTLEENKGRATRAAILALLADISLWNFEYEDVVNYVGLIEEMGFLLLPANKWYDNFYPGNSLSSIFEFQFNSGQEQWNDLYTYTYYRNRRYLASAKALELLSSESETNPELYRGRGSLRMDDAAIWKYCGIAPDGRSFRPSTEQQDANWIVYRLADILLMKAEALSQLDRYDEAQQILDDIRSRVQSSPVTVQRSRQAFEDAILNERAIELAFEGKRWFDLLRMGRRNNYNRKEDLIQIIVEKVPSTQRLVIASKLTDQYGWYLPILEEECERNSALEQNPYYSVYMTE